MTDQKFYGHSETTIKQDIALTDDKFNNKTEGTREGGQARWVDGWPAHERLFIHYCRTKIFGGVSTNHQTSFQNIGRVDLCSTAFPW